MTTDQQLTTETNRSIASLDNKNFGSNGFKILNTGETVTNETFNLGFYCIVALETSTITANSAKGDNLPSTVLDEQFTLFGNFESVTCTTGKILVYIR